MTRTPVAALFEHADCTPEDPWLFRREGWSWRWISFRTAADVILASVPPSPGVGARSGGRGAGGEGPGDGGGGWGAAFDPILQDLARQAAGEPVVVRGPEGPLELTGEDLASAAESIAALLSAAPPGRREILVLGGDLADPATRAMLAWATAAGAALLLESDSASVLGTAVWARPTLFAGSAKELAGLGIAARRQERTLLRRLLHRPPGFPFGRLRSVLVTGPDPLPPDEEVFWRERGVAVGFLPQCGIAGI